MRACGTRRELAVDPAHGCAFVPVYVRHDLEDLAAAIQAEQIAGAGDCRVDGTFNCRKVLVSGAAVMDACGQTPELHFSSRERPQIRPDLIAQPLEVFASARCNGLYEPQIE